MPLVDISDLQDVEGLCRVCLTESKAMFSLESNLETIFEKEVNTIHSALERLGCKTLTDDPKYPSLICSMCLSLLNITCKFVLQLKLSQKQLSEYFSEDKSVKRVKGKEVRRERYQEIKPVTYKDIAAYKYREVGTLTDNESTVAPVEIISSKGKYNLQDLIIIEEDDVADSTYEGFLKNLGTAVSADFVRGDVQKTRPEKNEEEHTVNVIALPREVNEWIDLENVLETDANVQIEPQADVPTPNLTCSVCEKTFSKRKILNRHMKQVHSSNPNRNYVCQVCGHVAKTKSSLYHHKMHHGDKFKCQICGKQYVSKSAFQCHETVHRNERLHLCTVCGKSFNYANALQYHMRLHTGEKKYKCTYCTRAFTVQCGLSRHIRTHTGARPYRCQFCDKGFRSKSEVTCHEMVHTGYRPYTCKLCGKGFTKTHNLKVHMLGHRGPHACEFCHRGFIDITCLKMHVRLVHGLENYELNSNTVYFMSEFDALDNFEDVIIHTENE